jgi:hypothetical protein
LVSKASAGAMLSSRFRRILGRLAKFVIWYNQIRILYNEAAAGKPGCPN